MDNKDEKN